jgi:ribonuclease HI
MGSWLLARREAWRQIKGEKLLLRGVRVEWKDAGSVARLARDFALHPHHIPRQHRSKYMELLSEELSEGVVREVQLQEAKWLNPTFLVPKAGGKYRKILDCRRLNEEIRDRHFKMEGAQDVLQLARPGDWATSLDFRSAFNHISVDVELRPYLCFVFAGRCYQYVAMPFGLKQAPRTFTRLMKRAVTAVRKRWRVRMVFYMDDSLLLFPSREQAQTQTQEIAAFFESLGWTLSADKCQMEPLQVIDFLGWRWDLAGAHVATTPKRRHTLMAALKDVTRLCETQACIGTRRLASLLGSLNFLRLQMPDASLHSAQLDRIKCHAVRAGGWNSHARLTRRALGDVKWWARQLTLNIPRLWCTPPLQATLTTDASPVGWGATLARAEEQTHTYGRWSEQQGFLTSNAKELTAVRMALARFRQQLEALAPLTLSVRSDNTTTVHLINNRRAASSLLPHLRRLLSACRRLRIELVASYLPGIENDTADRLSRVSGLTGYRLKPEVLRTLLAESGFCPTLDVFAREPELELRETGSERADAALRGPADCMRMRWAGHHLFLHPPLNRITAVLNRLQQEPCPALLITPAWNSQPWSPILAALAETQWQLGSFEAAMQTTPEFSKAGWRLSPGDVVATTLGTKTMRAAPSSSGC